MKKRVLSFLLCLVMLLPLALVSCGGGNGDETEPDGSEDIYVKPATLNFYIITDSPSSDEARAAQDAVQDAFNEYSRLVHKTQVEFIFCSAAEYEETVMAKLDAASASTGPSAAEQYEKEEIEVVTNDINVEIEQYPAIKSNQVDILLITSKDMYDTLREKGYLADVTDYLNGQNVGIKSSVNTTLLNGASEKGRMYAIPNNVTVGSYRYLLVNRQLAQHFYMEYSDFQTRDANTFETVINYAACLDFAERIAANTAELKAELGSNKTIYPMNKHFDFPTVDYFSRAGKKTIFGFSYAGTTELGNMVSFANVFENETFRNHFSLMLEAKANSYYPAPGTALDAANTVYGIRYIDEEEYGDYADRILWEEDYYVYEVDSPRLADEEAYKSMFAVSSYSASVGRSVDIIEALLSDTTLRNILQYGVEETHYVKNTDGTISRTLDGEAYRMNMNYTGNVVLTYPCREDGMDASFSVYFKHHNDAATQGPLYGFDFENVWDNISDEMIEHVVRFKLSADINAAVDGLAKLYDNNLKLVTLDTFKKSLLKNENPYIANNNQESTDLEEYVEYLALLMTEIDPTSVTDGIDAAGFSEDKLKEIGDNEGIVYANIDKYRIEAEYMVKAHIDAAVKAGENLMNEALACESAEEFTAFYEKIRAMRSNRNNPIAQLLFEAQTTVPCHGMLTDGTFNTVDNPADPWTLLGYLKVWYSKGR